MQNSDLSRYIQLAGQNQAFDRNQAAQAGHMAKAEYKAELDRQEMLRKKQEEEQRHNWWKQLIPGVLGLAGTGVGAAVGGLPGAFIGSQAGNLLGSGIAASQGVAGAAGAFNNTAAMSPMMLYSMSQMGQNPYGASQHGSYIAPTDVEARLDSQMNGGYQGGYTPPYMSDNTFDYRRGIS